MRHIIFSSSTHVFQCTRESKSVKLFLKQPLFKVIYNQMSFNLQLQGLYVNVTYNIISMSKYRFLLSLILLLKSAPGVSMVRNNMQCMFIIIFYYIVIDILSCYLLLSINVILNILFSIVVLFSLYIYWLLTLLFLMLQIQCNKHTNWNYINFNMLNDIQ